MDMSLGSPRSSSGYGSSEEDRQSCTGARRRRRKNVAHHVAAGGPGVVESSEPQTPQSLSPSDTGSSLSSPNPFSIDFRSVFDDAAMPDFSDLTAFSETDDVELPVDLMAMSETTSNSLKEFDVSHTASLTKPTAVDAGQSSMPKRRDKRPLRDDSHILVSLLKRPKAELDWITTGQQPPPEQFLNWSGCGAENVEALGMMLDADKVASASPLQRLKALTHSSAVNHAAADSPMTKTSIVVKNGVSLAPALPVRVVRQTDTGLYHDGRTLVVRRQSLPKAVSSESRIFSSTSLSSSSAASAVVPRRGSDTAGLISLPRTDCQHRRRSSPAVHGGPPAAVRRVCSELDDHRYSTPMPPTTAAHRPWPPQTTSLPAAKQSRPRRPSAAGRCQHRRSSTTFKPTSSSSSSSSSVLETLLLTSTQLRPNDGSDVSLATCRGAATPVRRPTSRRRVNSAVVDNGTDDKRVKSIAASPGTASPSPPLTIPLHSLLADPDAAPLPADDVAAASTTSSACGGELLPTANDSFSLFSEHLLCDAQGVIDIALLTDEQLAWTPSRLDDKVIQRRHFVTVIDSTIHAFIE